MPSLIPALSDRRRHPRTARSVVATCDAGALRVVAPLFDFSERGGFLQTSAPFDAPFPLDVRFRIAGEDALIQASAVVVGRRERDGKEGVAVEFLTVRGEDRRRLRAYAAASSPGEAAPSGHAAGARGRPIARLVT